MSLKSEFVNKAVDIAQNKSGKEAVESIELSAQTVMPRLIYVYEGYKVVSKYRNKLKNVKYFSGVYSNTENLWLEVADYIYNNYDIENIEKVFISGDGVAWKKLTIQKY